MVDIEWLEFEPTIFDRAQREGRLVLLVVTEHWCPHCRELMRTSFRAPEVVTAVRESFLATRVDAERRPDVNERYGRGSWPTIAYLTPEGELLCQDGFLDADALVARIRKVTTYYRDNREAIERGIQSLWQRAEAGEERRRTRAGHLNAEIVEDVVHAIYEKFDHRYGGWGESAKFAHPEALDFALIMVAKRGDENMREVVALTLDHMAEGAIHDQVDGGFFRFSESRDWRSPNFEKVLEGNASILRCYLEAWQLFERPRYRETARGIVDWMCRFLLDESTGAFFGTLDADADYYALDEAGRRRRDPPRRDRTIYTHANAIVVSNLLKASVVLEDLDLRDRALRTLDFLLENLFDERDGVFHYWDGTYHLPGMLADQAYLIRALVDASQHSGDADLLLPAERIAEQAIERQRAAEGGFYDILLDKRQQGPMRRRNRSILENSVMAEALVRLGYLSRRPEFHDEAVKTLAAFSNDYREYGYYVAGYGRTVDLIYYEPLVITVVGDRGSEAADSLRRAALAPYVPSRIVQMLDPTHDPILIGRSGFAVEDRPVAHVALGSEQRMQAHTPDALLEAIRTIESSRR
ncbi:MAG: thioredoxin domain-containing protein [Planctomycetes bacterium]|nr:thioredoxin domain-containing protein [Planctomycetota bacterium]